MATRFEILLPGSHLASLRSAGEEALAEIERVESWLSIHRPGTPLATVNSQAARRPVPVSPPIFELLRRALELSRLTDGAFDPTIGPLVKAWRSGSPRETVNQAEWEASLARARDVIGWRHVELDAETWTVRFHHPETQLDLGSIGKGWALDRATTCLTDAGIDTALLHGGTSTICAIGAPPNGSAWMIQLAPPPDPLTEPRRGEPIALRNASLSVSATWGRTLTDSAGNTHGHVLNPSSGEPVPGQKRAAVAAPGSVGTETDALSTALLVAGPNLGPRLQALFPGLQYWMA